tara:strand:- start:1322 stop:2410 length:1089 start_codon:yes stop_codon:yes gene_type:complete
MIVYWLFFIFSAILAISGQARTPSLLTNYQFLIIGKLWWLCIFSLTILIGLRYEVGGDWDNYLRIFSGESSINSLSQIHFSRDPGYQFINYLSSVLGLGIYGVNIICGAIFSFGLALFCRNLPRPLLALTVAIPYLIIVVSMGYSRQAVAIGIAMIGLVFLGRNKKIAFILLVFFAATMHKSAILLIPIAILASTKNRLIGFFWMGVIAIFFYFIFLADTISILYGNYTNLDDVASQSDGAMIRLLMNVVPAFLFLLFYKKFEIPSIEKPLWRWFSLISIFLIIILFLTPLSSAIDRIALYMIPLQLVVFSYLPDIFGRKRAIHRWIIISIISYYGLVLFVWLNYATHAHFWVPYQNILFLW